VSWCLQSVWSCSQVTFITEMRMERFQHALLSVLHIHCPLWVVIFSFFCSFVDVRMRCIMLIVSERLPSSDLDWKIGSHDWVFHVFPLFLHVVIDVVHQNKLQLCISESIPAHYSWSSRFIHWYILSAFGMALFNNLRINSYLYVVSL